ncbi:MAG: GntR family transcriptional regulator [Oscillospiraceae bacterium]|jgi:DNA-binding transcriptional regulator YhcF (GntR family)|nr:GntR family transcriptional regulator [Oscillospiraceae bacterium]
MLLEIDFSGETPIYLQIRNQVVMGIADGRLSPGEKLPTIRELANEAGINMMTANKAYALLKQEGRIIADRRSGAIVCAGNAGAADGAANGVISGKVRSGLKLLVAEAKLDGVPESELLELCTELYNEGSI